MNNGRDKRPKITGEDLLPGDPDRKTLIERMIRVDHAGEFGAARIYEGQLAVLGKQPVGETIRQMAAQEEKHLAAFNELIVARRVRPTILSPVWHAAGFALGAATAAMGEKAAMACTVAVEDVIQEHYADQSALLGDDEVELRNLIDEFRAEEIEHKETGLAHDAEQTPGYRVMSEVIKTGTRAAIWLSTRI
ncbi:MAG: demethoxyubiquinone hydroxylase family protein [Alphaproteobacteria bacterium]|nr:demethoxyubiquinone hydroxylase family protein [Alphaproteobacteria bacterium]HCP00291.1 demethoxyubiquinone hydroxylase family protein [Rhodospirillaceae bacterium]